MIQKVLRIHPVTRVRINKNRTTTNVKTKRKSNANFKITLKLVNKKLNNIRIHLFPVTIVAFLVVY
ncbi:hypothetical protein Cpap_3036 [Ruminiclostridium papyrosolvens DSM 2782]|uniref:Uncharacterized protein n=1 Tax=Ruminiclostridium papyrosolvens DSM 2782 TaxID=588581 RepID=F1TAS1_9FIRM|nr:hypothetical protein Cpap_3036 [Ruminiclostridium papyrosolvens DSM 2782]